MWLLPVLYANDSNLIIVASKRGFPLLNMNVLPSLCIRESEMYTPKLFGKIIVEQPGLFRLSNYNLKNLTLMLSFFEKGYKPF